MANRFGTVSDRTLNGRKRSSIATDGCNATPLEAIPVWSPPIPDGLFNHPANCLIVGLGARVDPSMVAAPAAVASDA
ncbi:hypothetical protein MSAS_15450 [Mycobacterium saskatchewanense]|nr:hypothetical protein MSAS_15450 [Mycobacterium saskatchewanense]